MRLPQQSLMWRKCCFVVALAAALTLAACGGGPMEPMPGDDGMLIPASTADTLSR